MDGKKIVDADWDEMKADLLALKDFIISNRKIDEHGGAVEPYVVLKKFQIVIPIKRPNPPFPKIAFKEAEKLGIGVAKDRSGIILIVSGKNWDKEMKRIKHLYLTWKNKVCLEQQKILKKVRT